jgi:hypothetical protein
MPIYTHHWQVMAGIGIHNLKGLVQGLVMSNGDWLSGHNVRDVHSQNTKVSANGYTVSRRFIST